MSPLCLAASRPVIGAAAHLSSLQPIGPGEELLVWYTVEDNPEITAALEEERAASSSSLSRNHSPRAKKRGEALHLVTLTSDVCSGFNLTHNMKHKLHQHGFSGSKLKLKLKEG